MSHMHTDDTLDQEVLFATDVRFMLGLCTILGSILIFLGITTYEFTYRESGSVILMGMAMLIPIAWEQVCQARDRDLMCEWFLSKDMPEPTPVSRRWWIVAGVVTVTMMMASLL